jgi:hypothetical protein
MNSQNKNNNNASHTQIVALDQTTVLKHLDEVIDKLERAIAADRPEKQLWMPPIQTPKMKAVDRPNNQFWMPPTQNRKTKAANRPKKVRKSKNVKKETLVVDAVSCQSTCRFCCQEVFTACPICLIYLCGEHKETHFHDAEDERANEIRRVIGIMNGLRGGCQEDDFVVPKKTASKRKIRREQPVVILSNSFDDLLEEDEEDIKEEVLALEKTEVEEQEKEEVEKEEECDPIFYKPLETFPDSTNIPNTQRLVRWDLGETQFVDYPSNLYKTRDGKLYDTTRYLNMRLTRTAFRRAIRNWRLVPYYKEEDFLGERYDGNQFHERRSDWTLKNGTMRLFRPGTKKSLLRTQRNRNKRHALRTRWFDFLDIVEPVIAENRVFYEGLKIVHDFDQVHGRVLRRRCQSIVNGRRCRNDDTHDIVHECHLCETCCRKERSSQKSKPRKIVRLPIHLLNKLRSFSNPEFKGFAQSLFGGKIELGDLNVNHIFSIKPVLEQLQGVIPELKKHDWKTVSGAIVILLVGIYSSWGQWTSVMCHISQFLNVLNVAKDVVSWAYTSILQLFFPEDNGSALYTGEEVILGNFRGKTQFDISGGEIPAWAKFIGPVGGVIAILMSVVFMRCIPSDKTYTDLISRFSRLSGCIRSMEDIAKYGASVGGDLFDYFRTLIGLPSIKVDAWVDINAWCDEVQILKVAGIENEFKNNIKLVENINSLIVRGDKILKLLDKLKVPVTQRSRVQDCVMYLNRLRDAAAGCGAGHTHARPTPLIVQFVGVSGVGKSSMLNPLLAELLVSLGCTDPNDFHQKVFYKFPSKDERWDGFTNGTKIVVCDDIFSKKDTSTNPSAEPYEVIRMGNTAYWQLSMAHLSEKGSTYFNAPIVLWTTNRFHYKFESLTNEEAVWTRVNYRFRVVPHPDFEVEDIQEGRKVKTLNRIKTAEKIQAGTHKVTDFVQFQLLKNAAIEEPVGELLSFAEMANMLCKASTANLARFDNFKKGVDDYMKEVIARCSNGYEPLPTGPAQSWLDYVYPLPSVFSSFKWPEISLPDFAKWFVEPVADVMDRSHPNFWEDVPCFPGSEVHLNWRRALGYESNTVPYAALEKKGTNDLLRAFEAKHLTTPEDTPEIPDCVVMKKSSVPLFLRAMKYALMKTNKDINHPDFHYLFRKYRGISLPHFYCENHEHGYEDDEERDADLMISYAKLAKLSFVRNIKCEAPEEVPQTWKEFAQDLWNMQTREKKFSLWRCILMSILGAVLTPILTMTALKGLELFMAPIVWISKKFHALLWGKARNKNRGKNERYATGKETSRATGKVEEGLMEAYGLNPKSREVGNVETYSHNEKSRQTGKIEDMTPHTGSPQMVLDQNAAEIVKVAHRNLYKIEMLTGEGEWKHLLNGIVLKGRIMLTNRHLSVFPGKRLRIRNNLFPNGFEFDLDVQKKYFVPDSDPKYGQRDVMLIELPRYVHQHVDVTGKFVTAEDFCRFESVTQMCMIGYDPIGNELNHNWTRDFVAKDTVFELSGEHDQTIGHIRKFYAYGIQTQHGECGSLLIAFDKALNRKILGIHAAGWHTPQYQGVGQPISQTYINVLLDGLKTVELDSKMAPIPKGLNDSGKVEVVIDGDRAYFKVEEAIPGQFQNLGTSQISCFLPKVSAISPSPVSGVICTPITKPAFLTKCVVEGEVIDPMVLARKKADIAVPVADEGILESCVHHVKQLINKNVSPDDRRVLSLAESITGVEGDEFRPALNRRTSPGYGWNKQGKGKTQYLGSDSYIVDHPEVVTKHNEYLAACKRGERPSPIWVDTLKDERRPIDKVNSGKTRLFSVGCFVYNLLFRRYFLGFTAHMMRRRIEVESCVGLNVYSQEWSVLAERLKTLGKHVIAGDFSNFDGTLNSQMLWDVLKVIEDFYDGTEEDRLVRRALWSEIVNSIHVSGSSVYMWTHSNPSGCPITAILNSVYHSISARYVYVVCARKHAPELSTLDYYDQYVRHNNYGDDDVWNIHESILPWFNQETITEAYATIGMTYTDEAKTGVIVKSRELKDIAFLKRAFRWDQTQARYRAPLSLDTIREMPMWVRSKTDLWQLTSTTLCEAVHELAQHDKQVYDSELPAFERARKIVAEKVPCTFLTFNDYQFIEYNRYVE